MMHYITSLLKFLFLGAAIALASVPTAAQNGGSAQPEEEAGGGAEEEFPVPAFRHVDATAPVPPLREVGTVRFITDDDFPPFSYRDAFGSLTGFNVMLAEALCADLRLTCEFVPRPWGELIAALEANEGEAILAGLTISERTLPAVEFTRPYFRTLARFVVRNGTLDKVDPAALAGKRIGVVAGTAHEAFLQAYFSQSEISPFDDATAAREALRTGSLDALFDDTVRHMYWLASPASHDCCSFAGGPYVDPTYFSHPLSVAVKRGDERLRQVLDYGLDRAQLSGDYAKVYRLFFPMSPW
jgi:polar amino acid transport system substrate-binding protein